MKIGYPCINWSLGCAPNKKFRLASYTSARLKETVAQNLDALAKTLEYNVKHDLLFFRISSDTVPFASHPVCDVDWKNEFKSELKSIGAYFQKHNFRVSMHPDQFVLLNTPRDEVRANSIAELMYHADFLDVMGMDTTAKIQIHVGGVYGDKPKAMDAFVRHYRALPEKIHRRLVIEHDDKLFDLKDCLHIHGQTGVPILFDAFHHACLNNGEPLRDGLVESGKTWKKLDGVPMIDYSDQDPNGPRGKHAPSIDLGSFRNFVEAAKGLDRDVMLEIRDKEVSALAAKRLLDSL